MPKNDTIMVNSKRKLVTDGRTDIRITITLDFVRSLKQETNSSNSTRTQTLFLDDRNLIRSWIRKVVYVNNNVFNIEVIRFKKIHYIMYSYVMNLLKQLEEKDTSSMAISPWLLKPTWAIKCNLNLKNSLINLIKRLI